MSGITHDTCQANSKWGGYNLDVTWDHKNLYRAQTGEATPFGYNRNTHAPGPGGMTTGCLQYLPPWPLCTVCARKGVDNLLNRTLPLAGTSGSTKQVWGYRNKTRSTRHTPSCHTGHDRLDGGLGTRPCLPKTEAFPASLPVCMKGI